MHAYLIQGQEKELIDQKINELIKSLKLKKRPRLEEFTIKKVESARQFRALLKLAGSAIRKTIYIIRDFDQATEESFHTLLKSIEEPPTNTVFIFSCKNIHHIPETLSSRMLIVKTNQSTKELRKEDIPIFNMHELDKHSKREEAISYLDKLVKHYHEKLHLETDRLKIKNAVRNLSIISTAREALAAGGNVKLQLTSAFLKLVS